LGLSSVLFDPRCMFGTLFVGRRKCFEIEGVIDLFYRESISLLKTDNVVRSSAKKVRDLCFIGSD
jgi:hypothetical protein